MTETKPLKVVGFNGSFKVNGNTAQLIEMVFSELRNEGIECELIQVGNAKSVSGCNGCGRCASTHRCEIAGPDDPVNTWFAKMKEADGIILGSPVYFANVSVEMKSLIDRCGMLNVTAGRNNFRHKIGAAVVAARRNGSDNVFDSINKFFLTQQMHVVGSIHWNNGKNMAYVLKKMNDPLTAHIIPPE
ncbi:MAG: putative flavodoxin family protein [Streblomastix strix]|uniref:Putative flavodoxin family protein n=1 Tax=Streblomastix strix TaxID=222440 RepID=A0A5J4VUG6_9EUKA|nr:MAG: putative flavodoxin family protein [Streblomastix strix]